MGMILKVYATVVLLASAAALIGMIAVAAADRADDFSLPMSATPMTDCGNCE